LDVLWQEMNARGQTNNESINNAFFSQQSKGDDDIDRGMRFWPELYQSQACDSYLNDEDTNTT